MSEKTADMDTRRDVLLEIARHLASLSASTIRLHAGEMTVEEMRSVRAVLNWQSTELIELATKIEDTLPKTISDPQTTAELAIFRRSVVPDGEVFEAIELHGSSRGGPMLFLMATTFDVAFAELKRRYPDAVLLSANNKVNFYSKGV